MIFDSLAHIETYRQIHPRIYQGLKLLESDFSGMADGRYAVEGDDLFYMLQSYETKPDNPFPEAHRAYADIQCVLDGAEAIGVGALEELSEVESYPQKDLTLYQGPLSRIALTPGKFVVLWPQDAHAAGIALGKPGPCHKCVVKVRID